MLVRNCFDTFLGARNYVWDVVLEYDGSNRTLWEETTDLDMDTVVVVVVDLIVLGRPHRPQPALS
eukprot:8094265-Pyramimonas_sp.AAC.1